MSTGDLVINTFKFEDNFSLGTAWNIICFVTLIIFIIYLILGCYYGSKFYKYRNDQILRNRFSNITILEIIFILFRISSNGLVIASDLIAQIDHDASRTFATVIRQIAFHFGVFFDFCTVYTWVYRFWCIYYLMNWITSAYNIKWQKLINKEHGSDDWYLKNKKTYGNHKYLRKYIIFLILISSIIVIPLRFLFDFATKSFYNIIGATTHAILLLIPGVFLFYMYWKMPKFEDFIYVRREIRMIMVILAAIYVFGLLIAEICENILKADQSVHLTQELQVKILISYYNFKEFGNICCLYIATGWVMKRVIPLINMGQTDDYSAKREIARRTYRPKFTKSHKFSLSTTYNPYQEISEDKSLLEDHLDVFENMSAMQLSEFERASSLKDKNKMLLLQKQRININDVLSHPKSFDVFMLHLSREFSMECLLSYLEFAQYRAAVMDSMLKRGSLTSDEKEQLPKLPFPLPDTVPESSIVYARPFNTNDDKNEFIKHIKRKAHRLYHRYISIGAEFEINISSRLRREYVGLMEKMDKFLENNIDEKKLLTIFDKCCIEMIYVLTDAFNRFTCTTQFLKLADLIFVKQELIDVEENSYSD